MPAESDLANPYRKSPAWPTMVFLGSSGKQMVDCWWCGAWRKSTFVSGGFARDVAGEKEGRFPSMLGVGTRRQRRMQPGQSRTVGGPRSFVFLAKPESWYAACAGAF